MLAVLATPDSDMTRAELKRYSDEVTKGIIDTRPPIRVVAFEC